MSGILGLIVYTLVGSAATVVMQSSHATMVLILTGLSAGQISYANALALAIGANIGTTITAIIGSLTANYQGKRLALAHLIFNLVTASVALVFINQLRQAVDFVSLHVGIADTDYALKLAVFHTIFNVLGVAIMLPLMNWLIAFLTQRIAEPKLDISKPKYLNETVDAFPATIELALRKEVLHLQENAVELIAHGLNIHRHQLYSSNDIARTVQSSRSTFELDIDARYEARVKTPLLSDRRFHLAGRRQGHSPHSAGTRLPAAQCSNSHGACRQGHQTYAAQRQPLYQQTNGSGDRSL